MRWDRPRATAWIRAAAHDSISRRSAAPTRPRAWCPRVEACSPTAARRSRPSFPSRFRHRCDRHDRWILCAQRAGCRGSVLELLEAGSGWQDPESRIQCIQWAVMSVCVRRVCASVCMRVCVWVCWSCWSCGANAHFLEAPVVMRAHRRAFRSRRAARSSSRRASSLRAAAAARRCWRMYLRAHSAHRHAGAVNTVCGPESDSLCGAVEQSRRSAAGQGTSATSPLCSKFDERGEQAAAAKDTSGRSARSWSG